MASNEQRLKNIKIKTGVVKRVSKEKNMYEKEVTQEEAKLERMKNEGRDEYDIRKQGEVLEESRAMVPDTARKLKAAHAELQSLLDAASDLNHMPEYKAAIEQLESVTT